MNFRALVIAAAAVAAGCPSKGPSVKAPPPVDPSVPVVLDALHQDQAVRGFHVTTRYLDAAGAPMGARFVHDRTGFVLDYLRIDSAPQGMIWVGSIPTSDQGEPHTQEHLLLGKGDRGRAFGNYQAMALAESSAFTDQWRTVYHFHTIAAHEVFWGVFADQLDGLLHPDYTDEEIRREVANFGVSKDPDGTLRLEEGGTVYNEMVRTYESPVTLLWDAAGRMIYGERHPLAMSAGGVPDHIRTMTPEDIRRFHASTHYLGNMGMIGAFPASMALGDVLDQTAAILDRLGDRTGDAMQYDELPAPAPVAAGATRIVEYPLADANRPSSVMLAWPASRALALDERILMELLLSAIAGDESTPLYKRLVDTRTRTLDVGATAVWSWVSRDQGQPVYLGVQGVTPAAMDEAGIAALRDVVTAELARLAALPAGDAELAALRERIASRLIDQRRSTKKFLGSPPGFGFRGTSGAWMSHLLDLEATPGFDKSLTLDPQLAAVEAALAEDVNPWTRRLQAWGLLDPPFALAAKPSPALRARLDRERAERVTAEIVRLGKAWGEADAAKIVARFAAEYDAATAQLEAAAKAAPMPPLVDSPPMTLDDDLAYDVTTVGPDVPLVASRIDSMPGGAVGLALRLDAVAEDDLPLLALLPRLLREAGLFEDGVATASEDVSEALRREVLSLWLSYTANPATGRVELAITGAGTDLPETRAALAWMRRILTSPDWRVDNVARLRDLVDQALTGLRGTMQGAEEGWVQDPPTAWWRQRSPLYVHTASFLTRAHDLHRLRWMLADPGDGKTAAAAAGLLRALAPAGKTLDRARLDALAGALLDLAPGAAAPARAAAAPDKAVARFTRGLAGHPSGVRALLAMAGKDLRALLPELPDDALAADWAYLCQQMAADLQRGRDAALAGLARVRAAIVDASNARAWLVASTADGAALRDDLAALLAALPRGALTRRTYGDAPAFVDRLRGRQPAATAPVFLGLVNPSTSSGVFVHTAPAVSYADTTDDAIRDYLTGNLFTGHGGHSMFMKTWAAGLAYSNGLRVQLEQGRLLYYAERCPELPQTMRFVVDQLAAAAPDPALADYAIAQSFSSRVAASYEGRAAAMAADLTDGLTPARVRAFRDKLLALRGQAGLAAELFARMPAVYGKVLPGYGTRSADVPDAVFFTTGPAAQLDAWASYLQATEGAEGADATLWRLYPRDFWVPAPLPAAGGR
jgi:Zn-dependent M16 (insulinase) family peptidase